MKKCGKFPDSGIYSDVGKEKGRNLPTTVKNTDQFINSSPKTF